MGQEDIEFFYFHHSIIDGIDIHVADLLLIILNLFFVGLCFFFFFLDYLRKN